MTPQRNIHSANFRKFNYFFYNNNNLLQKFSTDTNFASNEINIKEQF
jgi:hypothetical protein